MESVRAGRDRGVLLWSGSVGPVRLGDISPDGRFACISDPEREDLALMDLASGIRRRLTQKPSRARVGGALGCVFSRDGRWIAFRWYTSEVFEIRIIAASGGESRILSSRRDAEMFNPASWAADDRALLAYACTANGTYEIILFDAATGNGRKLLSGSGCPIRAEISPDGKWIAWDAPKDESDERDLHVASVSGTQSKVLLSVPGRQILVGWAPGGEGVLFLSDRQQTNDLWFLPVMDGKSAGPPHLVAHNLGLARALRVTPDASVYYKVATASRDVFVAELDVDRRVLLRAPAPLDPGIGAVHRSPDWSPDGKRLAYVDTGPFDMLDGHTPPQVQVYDSSGVSALRPALNRAMSVRWAPDGKSLLVYGDARGATGGIYAVDTVTAALQPLMVSDNIAITFADARQSPSDRSIYYKVRTHGEPSRLRVWRRGDPAGDVELLPSVYAYDLSGDGRWLVYCTFDDQAEYIRLVDLRTGDARELHREERGHGRLISVTLTPDNRYVLYSQRGQLWSVAVSDGHRERQPLNMHSLYELSMNSDGRRIAFTAGPNEASEIWVLKDAVARVLRVPRY